MLKIEVVYYCVYHTRDEALGGLFGYIGSIIDVAAFGAGPQSRSL
jgi:hypothetical protein